jgi:SAM-dependent methyltransferase
LIAADAAGDLVPGPDLDLQILESRADLAAARARTADRWVFEEVLCRMLEGAEQWTIPGFCQVCGTGAGFLGDWQSSDGKTANFRERLVCPSCQLNNRQRFMAHLLTGVLRRREGDGPSVYLYEQVTPFFAWAQRTLPGSVVGSEYLGHDVAGGAVVNGIRHEDALALSFEDAAFDVIVSNDVFEHVPDADRAIAECARVLRPGGRLLFSIPFHESADVTVQRAALRDGEVVELLPAEYHGNPVSEKGSLVFYDHGWDILERCRRNGFDHAYLVAYWSLLYGYLGQGLQVMFVARRA